MAQYNLTFIVPDEHADSMMDAAARELGWRETISDPETDQTIPNPTSQLDFLKGKVIEHIRMAAAAHVRKDAQRQADEQASQQLAVIRNQVSWS